jgi:sugar transferase (PEP-CTERM/EpsH1 system associated)
MNVLFVTLNLPYPPDRGPRIRDFFLIKEVARKYDVLLLSLLEDAAQLPYRPEMRRYCRVVEAVVAGRHPPTEVLRAAWQGWRAGRPAATWLFYDEEMAYKIQEMVAEHDVDIIQIEHSFLAPYVDAIPRGSGCKTVLDLHNIGFAQYRRMIGLDIGAGEKLGFVLKWWLMRGWEVRYAQRFDCCLVVSPGDAALLRAQNPRLSVAVIPNGVDSSLYQPLPEPGQGNTLLLIGTIRYPPNRDAVLWFADRILPLIERRVPDVKLLVVGHVPTEQVQRLARRGNVIVTGSVADVVPYYQAARVSVVPLRGGGGTRLKVLESMALGRPVVSTSIGCEGLDVVDGEHVLIADGPAEFAAAVIRLLEDGELRARMRDQAWQLVRKQYDWASIAGRLTDVYQSLANQAHAQL